MILPPTLYSVRSLGSKGNASRLHAARMVWALVHGLGQHPQRSSVAALAMYSGKGKNILRVMSGIVFVGAMFVGCRSGDEVTREHCEHLRDHVVDVRLSSLVNLAALTRDGVSLIPQHASPDDRAILTSPPPPQIDVTAHRAALNRALGDTFVNSCQAKLKRAQLRCALGASDNAAITACFTLSDYN